jgi:FKBP-type peptidyl-prolyl cis-trans isomerase SlyD
MSKDSVQNGVVVSMEYTLRIEGEVIDSSEGQEPLEFLTGYGNIISGLENQMIGMKVGDNKNVIIAPADGYGEYDDEAYLDVPRDQFPNDMQVEEGIELTVRDDSGEGRYARVESIEEGTVRLNFNHPLAGDELQFDVKVIALREPTAEELDHGHVHQGGGHHH